MSCFFRKIWVLLFLVLPGLMGSCQRASYHFQAGAVTSQAIVVAPEIVNRSTSSVPVHLAEKVEAQVRKKAFLTTSRTRPAHKTRSTSAVASGPRKTLLLKQHAMLSKRLANAAGQQEPDPPVRYARRGVAFALAVLLGFFGAHLFYIGDNRRATRYLLITLAGVALSALAFPIASLAVFGGGLGGSLVAIFLLLLGGGAILSVYFRALMDGFGILVEGV
ncbi:NINE protein [Hymenobacter sp. B1770]|uniref:NINE protein n=1 Tax=Hymenobacter sp. B1770 TaxID=1718788 RepID=UPI003CE6E263